MFFWKEKELDVKKKILKWHECESYNKFRNFILKFTQSMVNILKKFFCKAHDFCKLPFLLGAIFVYIRCTFCMGPLFLNDIKQCLF